MIEKKKEGREKKNKWKIFNKSRIRVSGKYICSSELFTHSRDKNFILSKCTRIYVYIYIREVETTWCIYSEMIRI